MKMIDFSTLNPAQKTAVFSDHHRILCLAGAGTGKTQVLTRRVARLSQSGIPTGKMLALTFTRAAGAEMKDRVISLICDDGKDLFCNTFHAFCVNVIRENADLIGYNPKFSIYSQDEQTMLMRRVIEDLKLKITLPMIEQVRAGRGTVGAAQRRQAQVALKEYKARLRYNNAFDFDSLIEYTRELLEFPSIAEKYRERYTHIFVDEFQDTDPAQWNLVCKINPENLFVVGDDFQAIYGFRGSDITIILNLAQDPEWQTVKLEANYRSTIPIIAAANNLIKHNTQTDKVLIAQKDGKEIKFSEPEDEDNEIIGVIPQLKQNLADGTSTAILARTNKQLATARKILAANNIPCNTKSAALSSMGSTELKLLFDWIDALENPHDDAAVIRIAYQMVSNEVINKIEAAQYKTYDGHFLSSASEIESGKPFAEHFGNVWRYYNQQLTANIRPHEIAEMIAERLSIDNLLPLIAEIEKWESKQSKLGEAITLNDFREYARLAEISEPPPAKITTDEINLMTVHGSKGLEFDDVIIIGANQGVFPSKGDIEEERRLFYVAITRARERLLISSPRTINNYRGESIPTEKSQFIRELRQR